MQNATFPLTIEEAASLLGKVVCHRVSNPLGAKRESFSYASPLLKGESFHLVKTGSVKERGSLNLSEEQRECVQECALVLLQTGWQAGSSLPWLECFRACRSMLRIDRKAERNLASLTGEEPAPFACVYRSFGKNNKERRKTAKALSLAIKAHCATLQRKSKHAEASFRGTLSGIIQRIRGAGWIDCKAFCNADGTQKSDKAIEFQIGEFRRRFMK